MNCKKIIFVTGNDYKFKAAKVALEGLGVELVRKNIDLPEIQDESVEEVAKFSARWAANLLKKPVMVSDGGCYIEALNGFPGPFIKYVNKWLSPEDLLMVMSKKKNRRVVWIGCLAYCENGGEPITDVQKYRGSLSFKKGENIYRKGYSWIDALFVPEGYKKPLSELPTNNYLKFWGNDAGLVRMAKFIKTK